jgi:hypothetical protein
MEQQYPQACTIKSNQCHGICLAEIQRIEIYLAQNDSEQASHSS